MNAPSSMAGIRPVSSPLTSGGGGGLPASRFAVGSGTPVNRSTPARTATTDSISVVQGKYKATDSPSS